MGVRLPRLKPIQSSEQLPDNRRINVNVPNQANEILGRTQAVTSLASKGADIYQQYEDDKINQLSDEAEQEYSQWNVQKLQELKNFKGDPTDAYAQYEIDEKEKFDEIVSKRPDLNERVKRHVTSNLGKTQSSQRLQVLKQRGKQQEVYENNLYESSLKLKKDNLSINAGYIQKDDPGSFLPFDKNISDIKTAIATRGLKNGTAKLLPEDAKSWSHLYTDGDGKVVKVSMTQMAKQRLAKEVSEGVALSIDSVLASGMTENSKVMLEKYNSYLDPKTRTILQKRIHKEEKRNDAFAEVSKIESKPLDKQELAVERIKDPEKKNEVLKIMATNNSRRTALRKNREDRNFDQLSRTLLEMKSEDKINGITDLESHPTYKATWDKLSAKQQKAITEEFKAPKKSDPKVLVKVHDIFLGNNPEMNVETMSASQFQEQLVGLSEADKSKMSNRFLSRRSKDKPKKFSVSNRAFNQAGKIMKNKLFAEELIENDKYGKIRKEDNIKLAKAYEDLDDFLETRGVDERTSRKELGDFVNEYVAQKKKEKLFGGGGFFSSLFGGDDEPEHAVKEAPVTTKGDPLKGLSNKQIFRLQRDYKRRFKKSSPPSVNDPAFLQYVRENK